jgi:hypothetical protein
VSADVAGPEAAMFKIAKTLVAAAALAAVAAPAAAQWPGRADLSRYDARTARTLGEQLVLCDLASFFATGPDLDAHRIYVQRDNFRFDATTPTAITRGGDWHDEDLQRAYQRHRAAGRVTSGEIDVLRDQYGPEMERAFQRVSVGERRFFGEQARFCRDLARASWRQSAR